MVKLTTQVNVAIQLPNHSTNRINNLTKSGMQNNTKIGEYIPEKRKTLHISNKQAAIVTDLITGRTAIVIGTQVQLTDAGLVPTDLLTHPLAEALKQTKTVYTVPLHVGQNIEVPRRFKRDLLQS